MAVFYMAEYKNLAKDVDGHVIQAGEEPAIAKQKLTYTGGVQLSAAFNSQTKFIRIWSDTIGYIKFGKAPVAVTVVDTPIAASTAEFFGVVPGDKVSVIA